MLLRPLLRPLINLGDVTEGHLYNLCLVLLSYHLHFLKYALVTNHRPYIYMLAYFHTLLKYHI